LQLLWNFARGSLKVALGDGIRRNVATVSQEERNRLVKAFIALDKEKFFPDGVSYWDKQEDIHKGAHAGQADVHHGPAFLPWHREIVNRLERMLREVDSEISLYYWDWTQDPRHCPDGKGGYINLFTAQFMGNANGNAGDPFADFESSEDAETGNGHSVIWRVVGLEPGVTKPDGTPNVQLDNDILTAGNNEPLNMQFREFRKAIEHSHDFAHVYIGGSLSDAHYSFHDPFVFLLHSNVDRLFAMWQMAPQQDWRKDPNQIYGLEGSRGAILDFVEPWAAHTQPSMRPWGRPEDWDDDPDYMKVEKNYKDPSLVSSIPKYDTT
jgi:tyrosinase-like protein